MWFIVNNSCKEISKIDLNKTGKFIALIRKEKELTQWELAEKLNLSEKTISKWEQGVGFPDISLILPLLNLHFCLPGCCIWQELRPNVQGLLLDYGYILELIVWDTFFIDWVLFANVKRIRLPRTENMDKEYHQKWFHVKMCFPMIPVFFWPLVLLTLLLWFGFDKSALKLYGLLWWLINNFMDLEDEKTWNY